MQEDYRNIIVWSCMESNNMEKSCPVNLNDRWNDNTWLAFYMGDVMRKIVAKRLMDKAIVVHFNMKKKYKELLSVNKIYKELKKEYLNGSEI